MHAQKIPGFARLRGGVCSVAAGMLIRPTPSRLGECCGVTTSTGRDSFSCMIVHSSLQCARAIHQLEV